MTRARKVDNNHREIVRGARMFPGVSVFDTSRLGYGFPDIVVGFRGVTYLFEIKSENGKLTDNEKVFFDTWTGQVSIIRNLEDLLDVIGILY